MRWKKALVAAGLLFLLMIVAAYGFLALYDFNNLKPMLARVVKGATGRELTIGGDIDIKLGFTPTLLIEDLSFQNAPWGSRRVLAAVKQIELQIALLPLLRGKFDFIQLVLLEPDVILEFNQAGTSNFEFETLGEPEEGTTLPELVLGYVRIANGVFTYKDEQMAQTHTVNLERLTGVVPGLNKSLQLDGEGTFEEMRFALKGTVGPIAAWIEPGHLWTVDLKLKAGGASFAVLGEMRDAINFKDLSFSIVAEGRSTSEAAKLAGVEDLPELGAFKLAGRISDPQGKLALEELNIQVGSEQLVELTLKGTVKDLLTPKGVDLDFTVQGKDAVSLTKFGFPPLPVRGMFSASGRISDPANDTYTMKDLEVILGENKITGQIDLNLASEPQYLIANLASQQFKLGPFTLAAKLIGPIDKLAMEKLDLQIGTEKLALIKLSGTAKDLIRLQGLNLNFGVRGRNLANFSKFTGHKLPVQGGFRASGEVFIPAHKDLRIPKLKVVLGKNKIDGSLELNLTGKEPRLNAKLSTQKLILRSILIQEHSNRTWARGIDELGPLKLAIETAGFLEKLSIEKVDLRVGTDKLAEIRLQGIVKDLSAQSGIDLDFAVQGRNVANLKKFMGQSLPVVGEYTFSGQITDSDNKVYRVNDLKVALEANELSGWLDVNLAGQWPEIAAELFTKRFNLKPLLLSSASALDELKKVPDLGPLKLNAKLTAPPGKLSIQQIDLNAGTKNLLKVKLEGAIKDLLAQRGLKLNFQVQGNEVANLEKLTSQSIPLQGAYKISGQLIDPETKDYKVNNLELVLGDNQISGWLHLDLARKQPQLTTELWAEHFNLKPVTLPELESLSSIPDLGPLKLAVRLSSSGDKLAFENLDLHLGNEELAEVVLKGTVEDVLAQRGFELEFEVRVKDLSNFRKLGGSELPFQEALDVSGRVIDPAPKIYQIPSFKVLLGDSHGQGSVELKLTERRPQVTAHLSSRKIDLRPVLAKGEKKSESAGKSAKPDGRKDKVFSMDPWNLNALKRVDADIQIRNKEVLLPNLALTDVMIDINLKNGNLQLNPLRFIVGGGAADGQFNIRSQEKIPTMAMEMKIDDLEFGPMLDEMGSERTLEGTLDVYFRLTGKGNSIAKFLAESNGGIYLSLSDGRAASRYLDLLQRYFGTDVLRLLNPFQRREAYTRVNCFVTQIEITDGLADCKLLLDTEQTSILSAGRVNLRTEQLDFGIKPMPKRGLGRSDGASISFSFRRLSQPFHLSGTLAKPSLVLDPNQTALTLGMFAGSCLLGPAGVAAFFADVSRGKEDPCPIAIKAVSEAAEGSGEETDGERKTRKRSRFFRW